jgi:RNA-binding protein PNO1
MIPIIQYLKLQIRFNSKTRSVELKTSELTEDLSAIQKGVDFLEAFMMGFEIQDAVALIRLDDLYIDSFMVTDVKILNGDHLSRAIGKNVSQCRLEYFCLNTLSSPQAVSLGKMERLNMR